MSNRTADILRHIVIGIGDMNKKLEVLMEKTQPIDVAREALRYRRLFEKTFGAHLFSDPAQDILLDLFVAGEIGKEISVSSAAGCGNFPLTTGLRYIVSLEDAGHIIRVPDPKDARRILLSLTAEARAKMLSYLQGESPYTSMLPDHQSDELSARRK